MTEKRPYSYTVLRYVHDVVSGEALNVGIVMHVPSSRLVKYQTRKTITRLKQVFPDLDRKTFTDSMKAVDRGLAKASKSAKGEPLLGSESDARSYAIRALPNDDSALQWSPVGSGITENPERTFERLYDRYVARYDKHHDHRRSDEEVWRPVRDKLFERGVKVAFEPKVVASAQDQIEFKRAWKNGQWHAYEPLSLDLANADGIKDKARRWRGHLSAVAEGSKDEIELHFLLGRPQNPALIPAYESAREILAHAEFNPEVYDEDDLDSFVSSIEDEVRAYERRKME